MYDADMWSEGDAFHYYWCCEVPDKAIERYTSPSCGVGNGGPNIHESDLDALETMV